MSARCSPDATPPKLPATIGAGVTLLVGGARSGKSDLAVKLAEAWEQRNGGDVLFVATAEALDDDMASRIDRHQQERPARWRTVEQPRFCAADVDDLSDDALLIFDCLTLLVSNLLFAEQPIAPHVSLLAERFAARRGPSIVVSNEVGMGVHPESALGRTYRDELGYANRMVAERSETSLLVVAGRGLALQPVQWTDEDPAAPSRPNRPT